MVPHAEDGTELWVDPGAGTKKMSRVDLTARGGKPLENDGSVAVRLDQNNVSFSSGQQGPTDVNPASRPVDLAMTGDVPEQLSPRSRERMSRLHHDNVRALYGRLGRKETCIVNASIMARSWGNGPKQYNKPIVVDIDLPLWKPELDADAETKHTSVFVHAPKRQSADRIAQDSRKSLVSTTDTDSSITTTNSEEDISDEHFAR